MGKQAEQKAFINKYILDCIDGVEYKKELETDKEKINFLLETFESEFGWRVDQTSKHRAFEEWLSGLPSCFNIVFTYCDIIKLAKEQGTLPQDATEKQENNICEKYWRYMTMRVFELHRRLNK